MGIHETYQGPAIAGMEMMQPKIVIVVAIGKNRELGKDEKLLWHIPDDLKRFKALTLGHPIIMGRKTFESIVQYLGKPLPGRTNIVITRDATYEQTTKDRGLEGVVVVHTLDEALAAAKKQSPREIHIGGGAQIYEQVLPYVDELRLTIIDDTKDADTFFPPYEEQFTKKIFEEAHEYEGLKYTWVDLVR